MSQWAIEQLNTNLHPENQFQFVYYRELKSDFISAIQQLSSRLYGEEQNDTLIRVLKLELESKNKAKPFISKHQHSIEDCCKMSVEEVSDVNGL